MRRPAGRRARRGRRRPSANVRTRVHEYGGGAWRWPRPDLVLFVDFADQRLYRQRLGEEPVAITPEPESAAALRYADFRARPRRRAPSSACARSTATGEAENQIVALPLDGSAPSRRCSPPAATSTPSRGSAPTARWLAWTCWDHPNMPWDGTELWLAPLRRPGRGAAARRRRRPSRSSSPAWDARGPAALRLRPRRLVEPLPASSAAQRAAVEQLTAEQADLGHPQWLFGGSTYAFLDDGSIACRPHRARRRTARRCSSPAPSGSRDLGLPFTSFGFPSLSARGTEVAFAAASPRERARGRRPRPRRRRDRDGARAPATSRSTPPTSRCRARSSSRPASGETAHGFYYPPANADFEAPAGERPPLIVAEPRRPDLARDPGARPRVPLLDQPRLRRRRRQLPRLQRLRPRLPRPAARRPGASSTPRTASPPRATSPTQRRGRRRAAGDPRRLGRRLRDPLRAGLPRRVRRRRQLLRRRRRRGAGPRHPQVRVALPRRPDRPLSRARRPLPRALADPLRRAAALAGDPLPGPRGRDRAAQPGRDDGRGADAPTASPTPTSPSRASSTASAASETEIRCLEAELYFYGRILGFEPAGELEPVEIVGLGRLAAATR